MRFLRVFAQQGLVSNWLELEPPLAKVLKCFDVNRMASRIAPVSVYVVRNELEEVQTVAALFQVAPGTPEKRFGILIDEADCATAGIDIDAGVKGETGIHAVDARHVDLIGTQDQFGRLVAQIVARMWAGEQRLRSYPAQQIAGQLAVFSRLSPEHILEDARQNCLSSLRRVAWVHPSGSGRTLAIRGTLGDKDRHEVVAPRSSKPTRGIGGFLADLWLEIWKWRRKRARQQREQAV
jgi:hypothetical protein